MCQKGGALLGEIRGRQAEAPHLLCFPIGAVVARGLLAFSSITHSHEMKPQNHADRQKN